MIISENNWINDNIFSERMTENYEVNMKPYPFKPLKFYDAAQQAAINISKKYKNLYVGLSGGIDSEYVLVCFHKLKIPIIPLIVLCEGNEEETKYAFKICKKLEIKPKVIECSNIQIIDICINFIFKKINGIGFESATRVFAAQYVKNNNGTLICGDHVLGDGDENLIKDSEYSMNEYDGYNSAHYGDEIGFYLYTPELTYSMISGNTLDGENMSWKEYKSKLFGLEMREKICYNYPEKIKKINQLLIRKTKTNAGKRWKKNEILDIFKPYIMQL